MNGLRADDYVPGAIQCTIDMMGGERDIKETIYYFSDENEIYRPTDLRSWWEAAFFNVTGTVANGVVGLLYDCYFVPPVALYNWSQHLHKFRDLYDFESAFLQNLAG